MILKLSTAEDAGDAEVLLFRVLSAAVLALALFPSVVAAATPCDGVNRRLTYQQKTLWAPAIAKQLKADKEFPEDFREALLKAPNITVLQSFRLDDWRIVYVDTHASDETFLFYPGDPVASRYVTWWGGAAQTSEERSIRDAIVRDARGIPLKLAHCFAWHVTNDRDQ
jgi:hypothetical protein